MIGAGKVASPDAAERGPVAAHSVPARRARSFRTLGLSLATIVAAVLLVGWVLSSRFNLILSRGTDYDVFAIALTKGGVVIIHRDRYDYRLNNKRLPLTERPAPFSCRFVSEDELESHWSWRWQWRWWYASETWSTLVGGPNDRTNYAFLPLWPFILATGVPAAAIHLKRWRHRRAGGCPHCGYSRAGLAPAAPCPECGPSPQQTGGAYARQANRGNLTSS